MTKTKTQKEKHPKSPMLAQHRSRPGIEAKMNLQPEFPAPNSDSSYSSGEILTLLGGETGAA